jgi:UDPglucose--hexose-1-phosphate uridylyltransferase
MGELREDYVLDRWVIIAEKRGKRPHEFKQDKKDISPGPCVFCPENEDKTPPEIGRWGKRWQMRWFENKFAAVEMKGSPELQHVDLLTHSDAYGRAEVIVETPKHGLQLHDMPAARIANLLMVYADRIEEVSRMPGISYVCVFKNHGPKAGTSLVHSHSQVIALSRKPTLIKTKARLSFKAGKCVYCHVIKKESRTKRRIMASKNFVSLCPYASRYNYEAWIFPKKHITGFQGFRQEWYLECAEQLKRIISRLAKMDASYNMFVHYAPKGSKMHMHSEVTPGIANFAGFEISSGTSINSVSPESAEAFYRK